MNRRFFLKILGVTGASLPAIKAFGNSKPVLVEANHPEKLRSKRVKEIASYDYSIINISLENETYASDFGSYHVVHGPTGRSTLTVEYYGDIPELETLNDEVRFKFNLGLIEPSEYEFVGEVLGNSVEVNEDHGVIRTARLYGKIVTHA